MDRQIKVLQVINGQSGTIGGIETFLFERYRRMDREKIHFDFAFTKTNTMELIKDDPILLNSRFFATHAFEETKIVVRYRMFLGQLRKLIRENGYDVVHVHSGAPSIEMLALMAASSCHVPVKIAHSHIAQAVVDGKVQTAKGIRSIPISLMKRYICKKADYLFACSSAAGETLFGKRALASGKYRCIRNGVVLEKLKYNEEIRESCRKEHGVSGSFVIGAVGRLVQQKNPLFMIRTFSEIRKRDKTAVLWIVGNGDMREEMDDLIRELALTDCVKMWGERKDVPVLMQGMDALLLPSCYEGLCIVAIEGQAAGLPVYASDSISEEHKITGLLRFLPLSEGSEQWAEQIVQGRRNLPKRKDMSEEIRAAGYDIDDSAAMLESIYLEYGKK